MRQTRIACFLASLLLFLITLTPAAAATPAPWDAVEKAFGRTGTLLPGDVFKIGFPRTDLSVSVRRKVKIEPALALGSWAAFKKTGQGDEAMVMGDLVLQETEVNSVMKALMEEGLQVTALHNHLLGETPRLMYMHYEGTGPAAGLAEKLRRSFTRSSIPLFDVAHKEARPVSPTSDQKKGFASIQKILGREGKTVGAVLQISFPRPETIRCGGMEIPPAMGTATALNFQPAPIGFATTGDFVLIDDEVQPVLKALRQGGVEVTAIHHHMLHDTPALRFVHFWAEGSAENLARALRAALDSVAGSK